MTRSACSMQKSVVICIIPMKIILIIITAMLQNHMVWYQTTNTFKNKWIINEYLLQSGTDWSIKLSSSGASVVMRPVDYEETGFHWRKKWKVPLKNEMLHLNGFIKVQWTTVLKQTNCISDINWWHRKRNLQLSHICTWFEWLIWLTFSLGKFFFFFFKLTNNKTNT